MTDKKRTLITAALPYANGPLHIGHIAGSYLPADIYARYLRANQRDVAFICGSDEHGAAITLRAKKEGITPQEIIDKYNALMRDTFVRLGIHFDMYHRTSSDLHHQTAQELFLDMEQKGCFVKKNSAQYYDKKFEQFLADRYITGTCPKCGASGAYGDQCEKCGTSLSPTDLVNPVSTLSGETPELRETTHWYLPMGDHADWVQDFIENGKLDGKSHHDPNTWKNHVMGQCKSWLQDGLADRAMTRDLDWGVKLPLPNTEGKVLYVWFDAPIGYISATKAWAEKAGKDWKDYWQSEDTELLHFIGKDNIVFHCIIFPIILKAHGKFVLPHNVPANEFLNLEGDKISTSRNWAVWVHEYLDEFPGKEDALRYVLCAMMPENKDSEFTWKEFLERNNNELVANLGNFINRTFVLVHKYFEGKCPEIAGYGNTVQSYAEQVALFPAKIGASIEQFKFKDALLEAMNLSRLGNKLLADTEPWKNFGNNPQETAEVLHLSLQICANLSIVLEPFLPFSTEKLRHQLGLKNMRWQEAGALDLIKSGHAIEKPVLLFDKIQTEEIDAQIAKLAKTKAEKAEKPIAPQKALCNFEDFEKLDLKLGKIVKAEPVQKADKLLCLQVEIGTEVRQILSGIALQYSPAEILGKNVMVLTNLAPRKMKGLESQGMILMAENSAGELCFVSAEKDFETGAVVR